MKATYNATKPMFAKYGFNIAFLLMFIKKIHYKY